MVQKLGITAIAAAPVAAAASAVIGNEWVQYGALGVLAGALYLGFKFARDLVDKLDATVNRIDLSITTVASTFRDHDNRREAEMRASMKMLSDVVAENTRTLGVVEATVRRCPGAARDDA